VPSSQVRTNSSMSSFLTVQRYITRIILIKTLVDVYRSLRLLEPAESRDTTNAATAVS
jgi:hypothetical protein